RVYGNERHFRVRGLIAGEDYRTNRQLPTDSVYTKPAAIAVLAAVTAWRAGVVPDITAVSKVAFRGVSKISVQQAVEWVEGFFEGLGLGSTAELEVRVDIVEEAVGLALGRLPLTKAKIATITSDATGTVLAEILGQQNLRQLDAEPTLTAKDREDIRKL